MPRKLYAIYDNRAEEVLGAPMAMRHDAAAIRSFSDILGDQKTQLALHPADYDLISLGEMADDGTIAPDRTITITGAQWLAAQQQQQGENQQ